MTSASAVSSALRADLERRLRERWNDATVAVGEPVPFGDGHSGFTYLVPIEARTASASYVLRLSPPGARIAGPADIGRQGRIIAALHRRGLPVPRVLASSSAGVVDGRAFMLAERILGRPAPEVFAAVPHGRLASIAFGVLERLRAVPIADTGIGDEPAQTLVNELDRWGGLMRRAPAELHAAAAPLSEALSGRIPPYREPVLVHGDYHFGNMLFGADAQVVALLDWEIAEIGDPRVDVASLAVAALRRRYGAPSPMGDLDVPLAALFRLAVLPENEAAWCAAFGCFKYAAILGYNLGLHRSGKRRDELYEVLYDSMFRLLRDAAAILQHGVDGS